MVPRRRRSMPQPGTAYTCPNVGNGEIACADPAAAGVAIEQHTINRDTKAGSQNRYPSIVGALTRKTVGVSNGRSRKTGLLWFPASALLHQKSRRQGAFQKLLIRLI